MDYVIRGVRAEEWVKARELRLAALQDPVAPIAFLETYEQAVERPDGFWQERTARAAEGIAGRQFIAEGPDGQWAGTVSVLVERPAGDVRFGEVAKVDQTHLVGVFVRLEARGAGVAEALFEAALEWSWSLAGPPVERVRLYVHEHNERAAAFYRRVGFVPSGDSVPVPGDSSARELELEVLR
ncbi:GNAT family N-acetyltransferase [Streptomyces lunaelactis]|uniref:GNAT family N-acetyltransferase n=1 Tax=Streptomyces lunaelactis TaxID=1535768 RepID=UPI001584C4B5|nr:GNAT family N-acetyltransferase [Streptomyces lunaelactis]NUK06342.1 GNAT family N-acetyltransferase [Streptomyces lunaelactis]NUK20996.1 GNAT family N-acetyltransferase [Streptomyces lunaelactis]